MSGRINIGWAKIAWTYGLNLLHRLSKPTSESKIWVLDEAFYTARVREVIL